MKLTHNIDAVQERLRMLEAELPKVLLRALSPVFWSPSLAFKAQEVLRKEWANEVNLERRALYERMTPLIVQTVMGSLYESGAWFRMTVPRATMDAVALWPDLPRATIYNQSVAPTGKPGRPTSGVAAAKQDPALLYPEDQQNLERVRKAILDWVTFEKEWDTRDYHADGSPYTPQERAERIKQILGVGGPVPTHARTDTMEYAAPVLAGAIQRWLDGEGNTTPETAQSASVAEAAHYSETKPPGIAPEVARVWLEKVLASWVTMMRERLPLRIESELRKLRTELAKKA